VSTPLNREGANPDPHAAQSGSVFETTHWSVVLRARDQDSALAQQALERLCQIYWRPLYLFIRRDGYGVEDSQDLTQGFFAALLEKRWLGHLTHQNGKFRSFLLTFLKHHLSDQRDRNQAQKRGGGKMIISLDQLQAEEGDIRMAAGTTPEQAFEKRWVTALLENAVKRLEQEYADSGKTALYESIKDCFPGTGAQTYSEIGTGLRMTETAIKTAVHRMRQRYGQILREEIANTVERPGEIEEEIRYVMEVVGQIG
jgi:RNA polymerase sigma factor (sigma-70 family)